MADFYISTGSTGKTLIARLFNNGTQIGADIPMLEISGAGGSYYGNIVLPPSSGNYLVNFYDANELISSGQFLWNGSQEINALSAVQQIIDGIFSQVVENGKSFAQIIRIKFAILKGKTTGIGTDTESYLSDDGTKPRVTTVFDEENNRINVTQDGY